MTTYIKCSLSDNLSLKMKISRIPIAIVDLGATALIPVIYKAVSLLTVQRKDLTPSEHIGGQGAWIF
jgi:hypothetical protein